MMQYGFCLVGKHRRDRHAAWFDGSVWRSHCIGCKSPMYREFDGWKMGDPPEDASSGPGGHLGPPRARLPIR
jgi:hypothetical protein